MSTIFHHLAKVVWSCYVALRMGALKWWRNLTNPESPPLGCVNSVEYCRHNPDTASVLEFHEGGRLQADIKCCPEPAPRCIVTDVTAKEAPDYAVRIPHGRVYGHGVVISQDQMVLRDLCVEWSLRFKNGRLDHSICHGGRLPRVRRINGRALMIDSLGGDCNYFHYLFDVVGRLAIGEKYICAVDHVYMTCRSTLHAEIAGCLGIPASKIFSPADDDYVEFDELIVPSIGSLRLRASYLRERCLSRVSRGAPRRIYLSRRDGRGRQVRDESQLEKVLARYGFQSVALQGLTFQGQMELFASVEAVVGIHGAGFSNLVFCEPRTKVVELLPTTYPNPTYAKLAHVCNLEYVLCLCQGTESATGEHGRAKVSVDYSALLDAIARIALAEQ